MGKMNYLTKIWLLSGGLAPTLIALTHLSMTVKARDLD